MTAELNGDLQNKVALITGGTSGIGRDTAVLFAKQGATVVISGRREREGKETLALIGAAGGEGLFVKGDVSKSADVQSMVQKTVEKFGRLDIAFNNAGVEGTWVPISEQTEEDWDRVIDINLKGTWLCLKYELRQMFKQSGGGAIVNMSSVAGLTGFAGAGTYIASKHGVIGLTRTAAFRAGRVVIHDEGSQLVALLVGSGSRLLDCCAAPGGKTAVLASRNPTAEIIAADLHAHRAELLRKRVRAANVKVIQADTLHLPVDGQFDRVLADVPCSGTGTLARNPEIKWRLKPEDISDLHAKQVAILRAALRHLAPDGRAVYSTCSLEREEDEAVVEEVLADSPEFHLLDVREELERLRNAGELAWGDLDSLVSDKYLRTIQGMHSCDGFFAAVIELVV